MNNREQRVLIMAGGTGGHVFPALAVAKTLQNYTPHIFWLGTNKGLESQLVPAAGIPLYHIKIAGMRGKNFSERIQLPFQLLISLWQSIRILQKINPTVVLGMGGFVSGPGGLAAWLLRKPLVIHEQNAKAGMTNTWLARLANRVLQAFPNTFPPQFRTVLTGNPVRIDLINVAPPEQRFKSRKGNRLRLLVLGGSLGAAALNENVPRALSLLTEEEQPEVLHQSGKNHSEKTSKSYESYGLKARVFPFIENMAEAYEWADLIVCRAGALTVSELATVGLGSILIPYPYAVDDHQTKNGQYLVDAGAAIMIQQTEFTPDWLKSHLQKFIKDREQLKQMAQAAWNLRKIESTEQVIHQCFEAAGNL